MTIITMVHDKLEQKSIVDRLPRHLDRGNNSDPLYNFVICTWDTFFVIKLGRNITMAIVWTTRKSIGDHMKRERRTKTAGDILIKRYKKVPKNLWIVNEDTLPNHVEIRRLRWKKRWSIFLLVTGNFGKNCLKKDRQQKKGETAIFSSLGTAYAPLK